MGSETKTSTYPGGIDGLLAQVDGRRDPLDFAPGETLPPIDVDLHELAQAIVPPAAEDPLRAVKVGSSNHRKFLDLRAELAGLSELTVLHGLLVAHLRKRSQPTQTMALFTRLWAEHSDHLRAQLNPRWQVSAITTFGDHGVTSTQRRVGMALSVLFGTMKLYESERRYSGHAADRPFPLDKRKHTPLPLEMDPFSLRNGGLDVNMLGRIWRDAEEDEIIQPLAHGLLEHLIHDPHTVFRRLRIMRQRLERQTSLAGLDTLSNSSAPDNDPVAEPVNIAPVATVPARRSGALTWAVVCTTDAPFAEIQAWAAHYILLGAAHLYLYLDTPNTEVTGFFAHHDSVTVVTCDAAFWRENGKAQPDAHQLRQAHNATHCLAQCPHHFLGHFDIDEFLISRSPVAKALDFVPADAASARVRPVELLAPVAGPAQHFKRSHRQVGLPKSVLETLYPTFGPYLAGGLISHTTGKIFARTGIPETRLGIHRLKYQEHPATNQAELPKMDLAHLHTRNVDHFLDRTRFRLSRGSYRKSEGREEELRLADILTYLQQNTGDEGLRAFYDEVCTAHGPLLEALAARDMLVTHDLALPDKVAQVFGTSMGTTGRP